MVDNVKAGRARNRTGTRKCINAIPGYMHTMHADQLNSPVKGLL